MSLAQGLSTYLNLNLLILIGLSSLGLFAGSLNKLKRRLPAEAELKLHYGAIAIILAMTFVFPFLPSNQAFTPPLKVWSAPSSGALADFEIGKKRSGYLSLPTALGGSVIQANQITIGWALMAILVLATAGFYLQRDLRQLASIQQNSFVVRRLRKVRILVNDDISVPFSFRLPNLVNVVMPSTLVDRRDFYQMAIAHELQHHRQGDTLWVYILWGLKMVCLINPAIHIWIRWITEVQEFACDETLVDQNKVESQVYARCLIEVANTAVDQKRMPVGATGLTLLVERNLLKRRIERMISKSSTRTGRSIGFAMGLVLAFVMSATAFAAKGLIQDRRVNLAQAKAMAARAQSENGFPVVVNDLVLNQLNRYIGTPDGRAYMRESLARMESFKPQLEDQLRKLNLPSEIMAIPIIESGYQNLPESKNSAWPTWRAAGVWQFIRDTAKNFGLVVNDKRDDRLNVEMLTDAALRYLQANHLRFKDWQLAALAYNMGESAVQAGIEALDTRDPWTLIRNGHEGDKNYLPKLMAAILIMRNPTSVN